MKGDNTAQQSESIARIREMATCAANLARAGESIRRTAAASPAPDSAAQQEREAWIAIGGRGDQIDECFDVAIKSLIVAEEGLRAIEELAGDLNAAFASATLVRMTLEASSQAFWLLEPSLDASTRVKRFMQLTRQSVDVGLGLVAVLDLPPSEPQVIKLDEIGALLDEYSQQWGASGSAPTRTERVRQLLDALQMTGGGPRGVYSWLCGIAHAEKIGLDNIIPGRLPAAEDRSHNQRTIERSLTWFAWGATFGYGAAFDRAVISMGWDRGQWEENLEQWGNRVHELFTELAAEIRAENDGSDSNE